MRLAKQFYGWPEDAQFVVPEGVYDHFAQGVGKRGQTQRAEWQGTFDDYRRRYPELAEEITRNLSHDLPEGWDADIPSFPADPKGIATREASGKVLNVIGARLPWLIGGAADLSPSTKTKLTFEGAGTLAADQPGGRNIHSECANTR